MSEKNVVILRTYQKTFTFEKLIYSFWNITLPFPVRPLLLVCAAAVAGVMWVADQYIPGFDAIPPVFKYGAIPYLLGNYMTRVRMDGKRPWVWLKDWIVFLVIKNDTIERFKRVEYPKEIKMSGTVYCRR